MTHKQLVARYNKFVALRKKGKTYTEIGEIFGLSMQRVQQRVSAGTPKPPSFELTGQHKEIGSKLYGRERARMRVRIRDSFTCQDCGGVRTREEVQKTNERNPHLKGRVKLFDVHHLNDLCGKNSRGYDSTQDLSGLITLCHKCHFNRPEHRNKTKEYSKNLSRAKRKKLIHP